MFVNRVKHCYNQNTGAKTDFQNMAVSYCVLIKHTKIQYALKFEFLNLLYFVECLERNSKSITLYSYTI